MGISMDFGLIDMGICVGILMILNGISGGISGMNGSMGFFWGIPCRFVWHFWTFFLVCFGILESYFSSEANLFLVALVALAVVVALSFHTW